MNRSVPAILWTLVLITGGLTFFVFSRPRMEEIPSTNDGRVFADIPWDYLPSLNRFQLTNQNGQAFDSATLDGTVYAISFFYASCPQTCRMLNKQIEQLNAQLAREPIQFVSISVDPDVDTSEILGPYSREFGAEPGRWDFLTGQFYKIKAIGEYDFQVVIDKAVHVEDILLIDKWGRFRDRFTWDDARENKRFVDVVRQLTAETEPPLHKTVHTRNVMAEVARTNWQNAPVIREFVLQCSDGQELYTRDLTGEVWVASFFFTSCPTVCPQLNAYLSSLQARTADRPFTMVSITTDPTNDSIEKLAEYAQRIQAVAGRWRFGRTGDRETRRISADFFRESAGEGHHSSKLMVVDRWGRLRGKFQWDKPDHEAKMLQLISELQAETAPHTVTEIIEPE